MTIAVHGNELAAHTQKIVLTLTKISGHVAGILFAQMIGHYNRQGPA